MEVQKRRRFRWFDSLNTTTEQFTGSDGNSAMVWLLYRGSGRYSPGWSGGVYFESNFRLAFRALFLETEKMKTGCPMLGKKMVVMQYFLAPVTKT